MAHDPTARPPQPGPRWKGGRPNRPAGDCRTAALPAVRVTPGELAQAKALAAELRLPLAELIRRCLFGRRLPRAVPTLNRQAWTKLGPLAANFNQYVKAIHQGQAAGAPLQLLEQLRRQLAALREELLGRDPEDQ